MVILLVIHGGQMGTTLGSDLLVFFKGRMEEWGLKWVLESGPPSDVCSLSPRLRMLSSLTLRNVRRQGSSLRSLPL